MATVKRYLPMKLWLGIAIVMAILFAACAAPAAAPSAAEPPAAEPAGLAEAPTAEPTAEAPTAEPTVAPAVEPTAVPAATKAPVAESITLSFGMFGSEQEREVIQTELNDFMENHPGISVELELLSDLSVLRTRIAAGMAPDVVGGLWHTDALALQQQFGGGFLILDELIAAFDLNMDDFLPGAQKAVRLEQEGPFFALPWRANLCLPLYTVLGISDQSSFPNEAFELLIYLTDRDRQVYNFDQLPRWYPTRVDANMAGCEETDRGRVVRGVTPEEQGKIIEAIQDDVSNLEASLRGSIYWPENQPTTFRLEWATGIVEKEETVLAGAVPVKEFDEGVSPEESFFLESNLIQYVESEGGHAFIVVGAVRVFDGSSLLIPPGVYAAIWDVTYDGNDWVDQRFILVDGNFNEVSEINAGLLDLNGQEVNNPADPTRQVTAPDVLLVEGSWWFDWIWDSRNGYLQVGSDG